MAAQRLQEWLKAAQDKAAQGRTVNLHLADSRRALDRRTGGAPTKPTSTRWIGSSSVMAVSLGSRPSADIRGITDAVLAGRPRWRAGCGSVLVTMARPARRPGNLPAEATSFIGRRRELAEVRTKLGRRPPGQPRRAGRCRQDPPGDPGGDRPRTRLPGRRLAGRAAPRSRTRRWSATPSWPRSGPARPGRGRAAGRCCCSYLRGQASCCWWWTTASTCSRPPRSSSTEVLRAAPGRAGARHQPRAAVGRRASTCVPRPAARPARRRRRRAARPAAQNEAVLLFASGRRRHRARLRADRRQPGGRRRAVPPARRHAAGDRAGGGADAGPHRRADPRPPGRPVPAAHRRQPRPRCRASRRCGRRSTGATTC